MAASARHAQMDGTFAPTEKKRSKQTITLFLNIKEDTHMSWDPDQPEGQPPEEPDSNNEERPEQDTPPNSFGQPAQDLPVRNYYEQPSDRGYVPPQATPLPLNQAIQNLPNQYIKILTRPGVQAFAEEQGKAEWGIIWIQLLIMGLIGTLVGIFQTVLLHPSLLPNLAQK